MTDRSDQQRVVITGMGWITPLGHDLKTVWAELTASGSGMEAITRFDARTFPTSFAAEVRDFDVNAYLDDPARHAHAGLNSQFAMGAARQAWTQAGLGNRLGEDNEIDPRRVGVYIGGGEGVLDFENYVGANLAGWDPESRSIDGRRWAKAAIARMDEWKEIEQEPNMPIAHLASEFGLRGPAYNCLTACAASTQAIGEATDILRRGDADVMLSGGTHTMIHPLGITGFNRLTALSTNSADPTVASRPFDRTRDGFVMGEGSGMVVLETLEHAKARGAAPIVEILGYGSSCDAFRITDIQPDGRGAAVAMRAALKEAGLDPHQVDDQGRPPVQYISAHGTGTKENDSIETVAVKAVFGELAPRIPMSSIKSMMGHLIAAAGAVELITSALTMLNGEIPPTRNLHSPDPELDLDYVPNEARKASVDVALSNNFGFGGQNDTLIISRYDP
ncbi:MAG: beta-ketoacyl-[acyl-carrier-protein] synthase family protein [Phycisphaerales bacterium]|nr:beta-ketoacyl-[acyl-carrier-protein] synthase family protein [Phycisphaerales bacterium]